jgi:excisionase family DNA binding protein
MNAPVTTTGAELNKIVAAAVAEALNALGFGARKAKPAPPKVGYSVKEAADASGLGRTTIYAAVRRGELRMVKKGARSIILDRDLRRWLEGLPPSNV